jgi:trk system potassium uptake protein TrkH
MLAGVSPRPPLRSSGPGRGTVDAFGRFVLTGCMLLGRLEIFTALALLSPAFWKSS